MNKHHFLFTSCGILLLAQTVAFDGLVSVSGDTTLGAAAYISCTYVSLPGEEVSKFSIWRLPFGTANSNDFYFVISKTGDVIQGSAFHSRLSVSVNKSGTPGVSSATMTAAMKISNIQCSDEALYGCDFSYKFQAQVIRGYKTSLRLVLKAHPKPPTITVETASVHPGAEQIWVYEKTKVTTICSANLGRPGLGILEWRLYHGKEQKMENVALEDKRVEASTKAPLDVGDPSCTERVVQRFVMEVFRGNDDLVIACFVHNAHFPRTRPSKYCVNSSVDMCSLSKSFCIIEVSNNEDEFKAMITIICVVLAGLLTTLIVLLWRTFCRKKPQKPKVISKPKRKPKPEPIYSPREYGPDEYLETESVYEETESVSSTGETEV